MLESLEQYSTLARNLSGKPEAEQLAICKHLAKTDLFFLLWFLCARKDMFKPWVLERCREVQKSPNGHLDLWAREHYKSTIITFGLTLQTILNDPEITIGIFSHTRPIAKGFLRQIKRELEANHLLIKLFPEVLYERPAKEAQKWSEDEGIVVKRKGNPKESTVEAWGLVDGQPIGKHYRVRIYDDVVTPASVTTPDMINKTTEAWELSSNLGVEGGIARYIGTRYHFNDTYRLMMQRGVVAPRIHPATRDGSATGEPVLMSKEELAKRRREQGSFVFASQMLLNPIADEAQGFKRDWIVWHKDAQGGGMNKYILVDPASEKKKGSDFTAMWVIGLGPDENYYVLDVVRDRMNLTERADILFRLHKKHKPLRVGYEKYGMMADIEHIRYRMARESYHFDIVELGGQQPKNDRIRRLIPLFENRRIFLPESRYYTGYDGRTQDLIEVFLSEEYEAFPVGIHDDMLDAMARILEEDLGCVFPQIIEKDAYDAYHSEQGSAWTA